MENKEVAGRPGLCHLQGYFGTEPSGDGEASRTEENFFRDDADIFVNFSGGFNQQ